jgi:hypothetical protein
MTALCFILLYEAYNNFEYRGKCKISSLCLIKHNAIQTCVCVWGGDHNQCSGRLIPCERDLGICQLQEENPGPLS